MSLASKKKWKKDHPDKANAQTKRWYERKKAMGEHLKSHRNAQWTPYGITKKERKELLESSVCAVCKTDKKLVIDHNHNTGMFRGVLCHRCNCGIGFLGDSIDNLLAAADYLYRLGSYAK